MKLAKHGMRIREATTEDLSKLTVLVSELFNIESDFKPNIRKQRQGLAYLMGCEQVTVLVMELDHDIIAMCTLQPLISTAEGGTVGMVEDLIGSSKIQVGKQNLLTLEKSNFPVMR